MGRDATKAAGNPWYQARKKAAEYDDRLCSRESAAEQLNDVEALWMLSDETMVQSSGWGK